MPKFLTVLALLSVALCGGAACSAESESEALAATQERVQANLSALQATQDAERHLVPVVNRSGREVIALIDGHERYGGWVPDFLGGVSLAPDGMRLIDFAGPDGECLRHLFIVVRDRAHEMHPLSTQPMDLCATAGIQIGEIVVEEAANTVA